MLLIVCGVPGRPAQASVQRHIPANEVVRAMREQLGTAGSGRRMTAGEQPMSHSRIVSGQTGQSLRLPNSAFGSATVESNYDRVEDNTQADQDYFRSNHSTSYAALGRVTGYYERAQWLPPGFAAADTVYFRYM